MLVRMHDGDHCEQQPSVRILFVQRQDVWGGSVRSLHLLGAELARRHDVYVAHFGNTTALYGTFGAIMLFMLWSHTAAYVMLIGAEFAADHERRRHGVPPEAEMRDRSEAALGTA